MRKMLLIIFIFFANLHNLVFAQDERQLKIALKNREEVKEILGPIENDYHFKAETKFYQIDLNEDGFLLCVRKSDALIFLY